MLFRAAMCHRALSELGAVDRAHGVTTKVLRESLVPQHPEPE